MYLFCISALLTICYAGTDESRYDYFNPSENFVDDEDDFLDPSQMVGKWYVLGARGYDRAGTHPKCWSIELSGESGLLNGVSNFLNGMTDTWITVHFQAKCIQRNHANNFFNVSAAFDGESKELGVRYYSKQSYNYVSLTVYDYQHQLRPGLKVIMSREQKLDGINMGSPDDIIDNENCLSDLDKVEIF